MAAVSNSISSSVNSWRTCSKASSDTCPLLSSGTASVQASAARSRAEKFLRDCFVLPEVGGAAQRQMVVGGGKVPVSYNDPVRTVRPRVDRQRTESVAYLGIARAATATDIGISQG